MRPVLRLALLAALTGCASSVVIRPDDPAYTHARARLAHTQAEVDRLYARWAELEAKLNPDGG